MNIIEPIGEAVTGAALARSVEPDARVDESGHTAERACLNCGTALVGAFCHACGQKGHVHRTLGAFGHDLLHGVLHFEGKVFRTLPLLLFRPGELTRRYIAGERARFVSPLALFLFSVFTMFAVISLTGLGDGGNPFGMDTQRSAREGAAEIARLETEQRAALGRGDRAKAAELATAIEEEREVVAITDVLGGRTSTMAESSDQDLNGLKVQIGDPGSRLDQAWRSAKQNPKLLIYKLQTNAYKFSWALIVLSVPFLALLFLWRWRPLYDHAVFVTYSITAVSILVILGSLLLLAGVPGGAITIAALLFIPWHMYRQLRGGYRLRRFSALWRTAALAVFANFALGMFAFGLLMLGVLG